LKSRRSLPVAASFLARLITVALLLIASVAMPTCLGAEPLMTGAGAGGGPHVRVFDMSSALAVAAVSPDFFAFGPTFEGGVRVAMGDVTGDGVPDLIVGAGPGGGPHVQAFDGQTGAVLLSFFAYHPAFRGGVFVAAGDVNGDGRTDIITGAGAGGGPHVQAFDGQTGALLLSFFAYHAGFHGGVHVAAGDLTGDGRAEIITGAGPGGTAHVRIFDGLTAADLGGFLAHHGLFGGGVYVAAGDVNGDGQTDIITGAGAGGGPHVQAFDGQTGAVLLSFFAYHPGFHGGVHVAAGDLTGDGRAEIITGAGPGGTAHVRIFDGLTAADLGGFLAYHGLFGGGVFVAARGQANVAPVVTPAAFSLAEHSAAGTVVGTVTFTDPDPGQTHTFSLTGGNTGGAFALHPSTGQLTVASSAALNFETTPVFSLLVQVTDSGTPALTGSAVITVTLTDVNEPPVVAPAAFGIAEHSAVGTPVGTPIGVTDPDAGQTRAFAITAGNTGGAFAIDPSTGQLTVANAAALDFETTPVFSLTVQATDSGTPALSGTATVTVTLTDANEAPVVTPAAFGVDEHSAAGTLVGTPVLVTDADPGQTHTFAITAGNTGGAFAIDPGTGQLLVANAAALDFETTPVFSLTVEATDSGTPPATGTATVTVTLTDVNEPPVVSPATFGLAEHSAAGTLVGTPVVVTDPDAGQTHTFAITAGNTGGAFAIDPGTGQLTVADPAAVDFETTPTFSLTVEATDTGTPFLSGSATITVNLTDANDAPVVDAATFGVAEHSAAGTLVGTPVVVTDPDAGQTHTFAITAGNTGGAFTIDPGTGQLTVADPAAVDFETTPTFSLTVEVTDDGTPPRSGTATITVTLTNVADAPVATSQTETLAEDAGATAITLHASDQDSASVTFTIVSPPAHGALSAVVPDPCTPAGSGATCTATVTYTPDGNFSGTDSFTFRVNDGGLDSNVATITVMVNAAPDAPVANAQTVSIPEDTPTEITLSGVDVDGDALTFAIASDPTQGTLGPLGTPVCTTDAAGASTCTATVTYTPAPNFNGPDSFTFTVSDLVGPSTPATVTLDVIAGNDPPVAADQTATTAEDTAVTITLSATDIDSLALTFAVVTGPAHGTLQPIGPVTCVPDGTGGTSCTADVTYTPAADYQGPDSFTYRANDGLADSLEATVSITVTAAPDAPTAVSQSVTTDEGVALLITLTATDPDSLALTFSPGTGPTNGSLGAFGAPACAPDGAGGTSCTATVTYTPAADYFGPDSFTFTASDGSLTSPPGTVSITVNNINDPPSFTIAGNPPAVNEDAGAQTVTSFATAVTAGPNEDGTQTVALVVTDNTNPGLFAASGAPAFSATGATRNLTYTPALHANGTATITVEAQDSGSNTPPNSNTSASQQLTITVNAVNDPPSFTIAGNPAAVNEDAGAQTVASFVTNISPGPPDESGQTVTFNITGNSNGTLFSAGPAIDAAGTLTYTPAANAFGTATITVVAVDSGSNTPPNSNTSASQQFTITVNAVNDPPSFTIAGNPAAVNEDAGGQTVANFATSISPGPNEAGQTVTFVVTGNSNPALFVGGTAPAISPTGTLTYTSGPNLFGSALITVVLQDNGSNVPPSSNTSASQQFTITVNAVNDPPTAQAQSYTAQANMRIVIGAPGLVAGATDAADVAGNAGYTPVFTVGAVNGVTPVSGVITATVVGMGTFTVTASTGAFTFDPAPGVTGTVATTYTVCDSGEGAPASQCSAATQLQFTINAPVIWFVAPNLGANGAGTLASPFNVLASANTAKGTNANHRIFVYHSTTPATGVTTEAGVGVTLDAAGGQWLVGQGVTGTDFDTLMGLTVPAGTIARPGINGTPPVIQGTVAMNGNSSVVRGLNITPSTAGAAGLTGGGVTGVTTGEVNVTTGTGTALNLNNTGGTVALGNVTSVGGTAVSINQGSGTVTVGGAVSRTGAAATGITVTNRTSGTVTFSGVTKTVNTATSPAVSLSTNTGATIAFTNGGLDIDTTSGAGFSATGGGTINVSGPTNTITTGTGTGLLLNGVGGTVDVDSVTSTGGTAVSITGGSGTVTVSGTVSRTGAAATGISVANRTSGTITFSGATKTLNTATSPAVSLSTNTGATINFTNGGLDIDTTSGAGFSATGGGTVNVTGANNSITSGAATALNITNTTIGANGLTFQTISSGGGSATGIILDGTGSSGGLTVTGDGTNTSVGGNSSGGTIANKSGADGSTTTGIGIYLNNTSNVALRRMTVNGTNQNYGIRGNQVTGFVLEYSTVEGTNGTAASLADPENYGEGSIHFGNATANGVMGTVTFTNNNISGGRARNLSIVNTVAGTTTLTIKGNTFGLTQNVLGGNSSLAVEARVSSGVVINATVGGPAAGEPNTFTGAAGDLANFTGQQNTTMDVVFRNNVISNSHAGNIIGGGSLNLSTAGTMTFTVDSNTMRDANGSAVTLFKASPLSGTPSLSGTFTNNTIGVAGVTDSGSRTGNGIFVSAGGAGTMSFTIRNNAIHQIRGNAHIFADNTGGSYTANFTIQGNTLDTPGVGWFAGIAITNGSPTSSDTVNVCADVGGSPAAEKNTLNLGGGLGIIVGSSGAAAGHTFNLPGLATFTEAGVEAFLAANNTGSFTVDAYADAPATFAAFTGSGTSCPTP
jgi:hypothetical protein